MTQRGYVKHKQVVMELLLILFLQAGISVAADRPQCQLCGMDLNHYTHVRYTISTTDQKEITTCGVQCGLLLQLNLGEKFKSATATTLFEHKTVPAKDAWYVYRSSIVTDMSPGFIAFFSEDRARRFVKGYGGKVVDLKQAIHIVKTGFQ